MDTTTLFAGVIFGAIGMGYIVYGRKQKNPIALVSGLVLCTLPYLLPNIVILILVNIVFVILPFVIKV